MHGFLKYRQFSFYGVGTSVATDGTAAGRKREGTVVDTGTVQLHVPIRAAGGLSAAAAGRLGREGRGLCAELPLCQLHYLIGNTLT